MSRQVVRIEVIAVAGRQDCRIDEKTLGAHCDRLSCSCIGVDSLRVLQDIGRIGSA